MHPNTSELFAETVEKTDAWLAVRAVLTLLRRHISAGELRHIRDQLPEELRSLWPS